MVFPEFFEIFGNFQKITKIPQKSQKFKDHELNYF